MEYKEAAGPHSDDGGEAANDMPLDLVFQEESEFEEESTLSENEIEQLAKFESLSKKAKIQASNRFSLKARRAIEDHIERRRLRKEVDYLFDDHFSEEKNESNA